MSKKLNELFENTEFEALVGNGEVLSVIYNSISKKMLLNLSMEDVPDSSHVLSAAEKIRKALDINTVEIYPKYPSVLFSADMISHVIDLMHSKQNFAGRINGYLKDIEISEGD